MDGLTGNARRKARKVNDDGSRRYTVSSANRALVLVRRVVEELVDTYPRMLDAQETYEGALRAGRAGEADEARRCLVSAARTIRHCLSELDDMGVCLRDWSLGIVDFPCWYAGREVRLCWQIGEPTVGHWHETDEGFSARRPVSEMAPAEPAAV